MTTWLEAPGSKGGLGGESGGGGVGGSSEDGGDRDDGGGATRLHVMVPAGHELPAVEMQARTVPATNMHGPDPVVQPSQLPVPS